MNAKYRMSYEYIPTLSNQPLKIKLYQSFIW